MQTMSSTMPVGFYDWEPEHFPREEYEARIAALWSRIPDPECAGIVVYGNLLHHAELAWLTNFMPKLDSGFLLLARNGPPVLLGSQSKNHLPSAKPLTWIEDVRVMTEPGKAILDHLQSREGGSNHSLKVALVGGDFMREALRREVLEALGAEGREANVTDATADAFALMRVKRPRERDAIGLAIASVKAARDAFATTVQGGGSAWEAISAAELAACRLGAQDARSLASLDGGRSYRPLITPAARGDLAPRGYFAVRHTGYWAEGFVSPEAPGGQVAEAAAKGLAAILDACHPGVRASALAEAARAALAPCAPHGLNAADFGSGIGLALEGEPHIAIGDTTVIEEGEVLALRVGASLGDQHAICSAMILVGGSGAETLLS